MPMISPLLPAADEAGSWWGGISSLMPSFSWGGGNPPPAMPTFGQQGRNSPEGGQFRRLPPPDIPQMPPVQSQSYDPLSSIQTPRPSAAPSVQPQPSGMDMEQPEASNKFSFMDNPGASDAMVAFGAAMLKAPDFNTGLGDAALAVNNVAQKYRMPTEQDYARAKMLGMTARLARGYSMTDPGQAGGGVEVDQKIAYEAPDGEILWAATDSNGNPGVWASTQNKFIPGGVPGMVDRRDTGTGAYNDRSAKNDADAEGLLYDEAMAANDNIIRLNQMQQIAPTAGIGMDGKTRIARAIVQLTGAQFGDIDPTSVSTLDSSTKQLGLNWSQKMKGQGQVTEAERKLIADMLPQALSDSIAFANLVTLLKQVEQRKQQMADEWFKNQVSLRREYGSFRGYMLSRVKELEITAPAVGTSPSGNAAPANQELEDALKQYGG